MPLSEADFYAYSRATGTPVPRDAQERAEIAPQVVGFRQGQLSATKEELDQGNFIDTAGKTALLAGLGAGAIALGTGGRFGRLRESLAGRVRPKDKGAATGVKTVDLNVENIPTQKVSAQDITRPSEVSPSLLALPEETAAGRKQRIIQETLRRNPLGAGTSAEAQFTPKGVDVDISARTGREGPLPEYLARARETPPERFKELEILQGNMDMADLFYRTKGTGKDVPALPPAMTPRSYIESTGAVAPSSSSPASRRARNQQKDLDRIRSSMSDVIDSVVDEDYFDTEAPSSLINLANKIQNSDIPLTTETVQEYKNWAQKTFANDPTVLSEINEDLSSLPLLRDATAPAPSSTLRKGKDPVDVLLEERELAAQRNRAQAIRAQEAKTIGKGERLLAKIQAETLVEKQNARRPLVSEQSAEAVDTGADQVFGRVMEDVQRNEDLSISSAASYLNNRRDEIASMLGEQGLTVTPGRIEEALGYEFGPKAYTFGPKQTQRKQALQLGATYNTNFFENLKTPSVQIAGETVPTSSLKQPTVMKETAERLGEKVDRAKDAIGRVALGQRMKEVRFEQGQKQLRDLGAYAQELKTFAQTTKNPLMADRAMGRRSDVLLEYDMLENRLNQSLGPLESGRRGADRYREVVGESISEMKLPDRLKPGIEEGQRIYFQQDPKTLQPIPGTQEIRSERKMIDTEPRTGGGRQAGEFTGAESAVRNIDIYGVQPLTQKGADPSLKPSTPRYTQAEIEEAALSLSRTDPETGAPIPPRREAVIQSMGKQRKTPEGRASIDVSRELTALQRQANQGNPRAQAQLQSFIQNMRLV